MKGYRFYLEYQTSTKKKKGTVKNPGDHTGNVIAVSFKDWHTKDNQFIYDAIGAMYFRSNSPVGSTTASENYLEHKCKRIPERLAREIHPNLFHYLDE